jgi:hypothetical protein
MAKDSAYNRKTGSRRGEPISLLDASPPIYRQAWLQRQRQCQQDATQACADTADFRQELAELDERPK